MCFLLYQMNHLRIGKTDLDITLDLGFYLLWPELLTVQIVFFCKFRAPPTNCQR